MPDAEATIEKLKELALAEIKDRLEGFVEREEVKEFAKEKAKLIAEETVRAMLATDPDKKQEHEENAEILRSQIKAEFHRLTLNLAPEVKDTVVRILEGVLGIVIRLGKGALLAAL